MGIRNQITSGNSYFLTLTIIEWIDVVTKPAYKHLIVDSLNHCVKNKGLMRKGIS